MCVCVCVCVCLSNFLQNYEQWYFKWPINSLQIIKSWKAFFKSFGYKVMATGITHGYRLLFSDLEKISASIRRIHRNTTHYLWRLLLMKHCFKSNTQQLLKYSTLAPSFLHLFYFMPVIQTSCFSTHEGCFFLIRGLEDEL